MENMIATAGSWKGSGDGTPKPSSAIRKIEELPPHHPAAGIMRDVENWSCAEIAEVFRVSVGGVKTRLHRARLFIRKRWRSPAGALPRGSGGTA
jgi:Sigma-70, region 4